MNANGNSLTRTSLWNTNMTEIYFNGQLVWSKSRLPTEEQARKAFRKLSPSSYTEAWYALSCGLDVQAREGYYKVILNTDERTEICKEPKKKSKKKSGKKSKGNLSTASSAVW